MSQRELEKEENRIPPLVFEFVLFQLQSHPLRFRLRKKSQAKKARDCLGGPGVVFSDRNDNILEGKNEETKQLPTWSSKKRGKRPYSVERAKDPSTENIVSDAFWGQNMGWQRQTKQNPQSREKGPKYSKT